MKRIPAILILGCLLLAAPFAVSGTENEVLTVNDLKKAYADNPAAAEAKYLGKIVLVKGFVLSAAISRYLTPAVTLSDREGGEAQAICVLPRLDVGKLSAFKAGQSVTMSGKVYRLTADRVVIKECSAVE